MSTDITINARPLADILADHREWLEGGEGQCADLRGADLSGADLGGACLSRACLSGADLRWANLSGADLSRGELWGTVGNMSEIKSIQLDRWPVTYTAEVMQIGCQSHPIADWWAFDDERIDQMDRNALAWWRKWKPVLQQTIETSPATPTGKETHND